MPNYVFGSSGVPGFTTPAYGSVGGNLPWSNAGGGSSYSAAYNSALGQNASNYTNILSGYRQVLQDQQAAQAQIAAGYNALDAGVQSRIAGIGKARNQQIIDRYRAETGKQQQGLNDRGLGNTTVVNAVSRGLEYDRTKGLNENNENIAGLQANYMSQIGQARLGEMARAQQANSGLVGRQLDWMNSVSAQYPDRGSYDSQSSGAAAPMGGSFGAPGLGLSTGGRNWGNWDGGGGSYAPAASTGGGYNIFAQPAASGASWNTIGEGYSPRAAAGGNGIGLLDSGMGGGLGLLSGGMSQSYSPFY